MISLRNVTVADSGLVLTWAQDPELKEYFRRYPPIQDWTLPDQFMAGIGWGYIVQLEGQPIGLIQLLNADTQARSIELAMMIDTKLCPQRLEASYEAHRQLCTYVFGYMDYNKVSMKILTHRSKLKQRLEEDGYKLEAHLRQSCRYDGRLVDEWVLGLLRDEWRNK